MKKLITCLSFILSLMQTYAQSSIICTIAGNGTASYNGDNISSISASLNGPAGIAVDASGNIYIADHLNHRVRKVTPNGIITTIAGTGTAGFSGDNGLATSAMLKFPINIAIDDLGNLYVSDYENHRIRKIMPNGIISTVAGGGTGGDGVLAINAQLAHPNGVTFDDSGNMYIADRDHNKIRKVDVNGIISTYAGGGGGLGDGGLATSARLNAPNGIVFDNLGNLYITDQSNNRIRKVNINGIISTIAGDGTAGFSGDGGLATSAKLRAPNGITIDNSNNILFTDFQNHRVRMIDANGIISTIAGNGSPGFSGDGGSPVAAQLSQANGVALDLSGNYFISEYSSHRIRKVYVPQLMDVVLTSSSGTDEQTACINTMITPITYSTNNIENVTVSGLPNGVNSAFNSNVLTINGSPTLTGTFTYTISFNQNTICATPLVKTGTITVIDRPSIITNASNLSICNGGTSILSVSGANNYEWSPSIGLNTTTGETVIANPTETTTYTVTGSNDCGTDVKTITITVKNAPIVTVQSTNNNICLGNTATLTATGADTYVWSPSFGLNTTSGSIVAANPTVTTTYTVIGSNECGSDIKTLTIIVKSLPPVFVNNPQICEGQTARLIAGGADSYSWSQGVTPVGVNIATASPTVTTTYTVTGYKDGCEGVAVSTVTVKPAPVITVNSETICTGESATLTATGAYTYQWSTGETSNSITVSPTSTTTYTVMGWSRCCSCEGNVAVSTVTVKPRPIVTASSVTVCYGETAFLEASGADNYVWSEGVTPIGVNTAIASPSVTTTYTVIGDVNGCKDEAEGTITVPFITVNSAIICQGENAVLTAHGGSSYVWSNGETTSSITVSPNATESYTVTAVVRNCIRCNASATATVTVKPKPVVTISGPTAVCGANNPVTMTAYGADSYYWVNIGVTSNPYTDYPSYDYDYQVQGTSNGCSSLSNKIHVTVNPKPVVRVTAEKVNSRLRRVIANVQAGSGSGFTYQWYRSTSESGPWTEQNKIVGATSSTYVFDPRNNPYFYGVVVINSNGCDNKVDNKIPSTRSSEEAEEYFNLSPESVFDATIPDNIVEIVLSPNPNNGNMTLTYYLGEADKASMNIYDISGRIVASYSLDIQSGLLNINNEQLTSGVYFYEVIIDQQEVKREKIVIVK